LVRVARQQREYCGGEGVPCYRKRIKNRKQGLSGIMQHLAGLEFPLNKGELIEQLRDEKIEYIDGLEENLEEILEHIPEGDYDTPSEVAMAIADVLEEEKIVAKERRRRYAKLLWGENNIRDNNTKV